MKICPEVLKFAEAMQTKIDRNKHKDNWACKQKGERSWKNCDIEFLISKLQEEVVELVDAIDCGEPFKDVLDEAADVGNIAMMIADNLKVLKTPLV